MPARHLLFALAVAVSTPGCQRDSAASATTATTSPPAATPAASTGKMTEAAFRQGMAIESVKEVRYLGQDGRPLSFDQFIGAVQGGKSFKKEVEGDKSLAVMTINADDASLAAPAESGVPTPLAVPVSALLPPLKDKDLGGTLNVLANGEHYTLLSFFFADCVPCIQEVPALNALAQEQHAVRVVSLTFEPQDVARQFASRRGLKSSIIPEAQAYIDALGVKVYPTLILVSPEGRLMGVRSSYRPSGSDDAGLAELKAWMASLGVKA